MLKKLRIKFVCINMALVTVMLCIILGLVVHFTSTSLETESLQMMRSVASVPIRNGGAGDVRREIHLPYFQVHMSPRGEIIAISGSFYDLSDEEQIRQIVAYAMASGEEAGILSEYSLRFLKTETPVGQNLVFADMTAEETTLGNLIRNCVVIGITGFVLFLVLSLWLANWAVKPVDQAWLQQKQFVADASHELKTPLTVIMTNAELLQNPNAPAPEQLDYAENILTMSRQMRRLVESLLELARADNGAVRTAFSEFDLSEVLCEGLLPFEPLYFEKDLLLTSRIQPEIQIRGSASHLNQVLEILLDNAMKYSFAGGEVSVSLHRQGKHATITVSNPGPAIEGADLKNIFKRFYRVDKSRTRDGSYGLGLSIAEAVIREHRGKIWAESKDGINTVHVQLPVL